jgi:hypothetical protein
MNVTPTDFGFFVKEGQRFHISPSEGQTREQKKAEAIADGYALDVIGAVRLRKKAGFAADRYAEETGGTTLSGGMFIRTDARTQAALSNGAMMARADPDFVFENWKLDDGTFIDMDEQTVTGIYEAVVGHVAAAFAKEKSLCDAVDAAATIQEVNAIEW